MVRGYESGGSCGVLSEPLEGYSWPCKGRRLVKIPSRGRASGTGSESLVGIDRTVVRAGSGVTAWSPAHPSVQEAVEPMRSLKVQSRQIPRGSSWRAGKPVRWEDPCNWPFRKLEEASWAGRGSPCSKHWGWSIMG